MTVLTVAMPTYRTPADLLRRGVRSVLDQTMRDLHLVVVNDGGNRTDLKTISRIRDTRLTIIHQPTNRGVHWTRAAILAATTTPWFAGHDADDTTHPDMYQRLVDAATPATDGVVCGYTVHRDGKPPTLRPPRVDNIARLQTRRPALVHVTSQCAAIWNTTHAQTTGGPDPTARISDDRRWVASMIRAGTIVVVDDCLYDYHIRPGTLTTSGDTAERSQARARAHRQRARIWQRQHTTPPARWSRLIPTPAPFLEDVALFRKALA